MNHHRRGRHVRHPSHGAGRRLRDGIDHFRAGDDPAEDAVPPAAGIR